MNGRFQWTFTFNRTIVWIVLMQWCVFGWNNFNRSVKWPKNDKNWLYLSHYDLKDKINIWLYEERKYSMRKRISPATPLTVRYDYGFGNSSPSWDFSSYMDFLLNISTSVPMISTKCLLYSCNCWNSYAQPVRWTRPKLEHHWNSYFQTWYSYQYT